MPGNRRVRQPACWRKRGSERSAKSERVFVFEKFSGKSYEPTCKTATWGTRQNGPCVQLRQAEAALADALGIPGTLARMVVPRGLESNSSLPPNSRMRSLMP